MEGNANYFLSCHFSRNKYLQLAQHTIAYAQDEDLLVTEFSVVGHTSSSSSSSNSISSTIGDISTSSSGFSSSGSTTGSGSASTEIDSENNSNASTNENSDITIETGSGKLTSNSFKPQFHSIHSLFFRNNLPNI